MSACGLALLRSWYVSRKSRRGFSASGHTMKIKSEDLEYLAVINYEDLEQDVKINCEDLEFL